MRLLIDSLIAVMLIGILAGVLLHHRAGQQAAARVQQACEALARLHEQVVYHAALTGEVGDPSFPNRVDRAWFPDGVPVNALAGASRPWIDSAPQGDKGQHPPDPVLDRPNQAGFWYNPASGIVRARVPRQITGQDTLDLYNHVNATALPRLPGDDDPARTPVAPQPIAIRQMTEQAPAPQPVPRARPSLLDRES